MSFAAVIVSGYHSLDFTATMIMLLQRKQSTFVSASYTLCYICKLMLLRIYDRQVFREVSQKFLLCVAFI